MKLELEVLRKKKKKEILGARDECVVVFFKFRLLSFPFCIGHGSLVNTFSKSEK